MKISKLFHWLYAFLMLLPVLALAPSLFYFAFNQKSQNYTDVQVTETYEYETNEVNSVDDLVEGNIYKYSTYDKPHAVGVCTIYCDYINLYKYDVANIQTNANLTVPRFYQGNDNVKVWVSPYSTTTGNVIYNIGCYDAEFYFVLGENNNYANIDISFISESDYLGEKNVDVVRSEQSPMNIFYTAVNYVYDMPVFSWAKNSFLALPITYVTGLFGMASNNVVNYYLSYWLAISIVYLVFDLVMYVPLLVHRWIDKGMIE